MTAIIRHIANLGLLLSFVTLAVTGVMSFVLPFSITTARVHIVFGGLTGVLVLLHLATRLRYFTRIAKQSVTLKAKTKPQVPRWLVASIVVVWAGLLWVSFNGRQPATGLIALGFEARHKAEIFRAAPQTVYEQVADTNRIVSLSPQTGELVVDVQIEYRQPMDQQPAAAVWAETSRGRMIQTLFVDSALAYADEPVWHGRATPRHHILPIWRHGYTAINGIDPAGEADALTAATPMHSFSIENSLATEEGYFVICLEINAPADANAHYTDEHLGQPSVLYQTDRINLDDEQAYYLMYRTAHGGNALDSGERSYNFDGFTTGDDLIEKVLVHVVRPARDRAQGQEEGGAQEGGSGGD